MAELDQMSVEMLENVSHYVRRLRRHARTVNKTGVGEKWLKKAYLCKIN